MNNVKVKGVATVTLTMLALACFAGCGEDTPDIAEMEDSTIYLTKDGTVTAYLVEEFDRDYYDITELEQMIQLEIEDYLSQAHAGEETVPVQLVDICSPREKNGVVGLGQETTVAVCMEYASAEHYSAYNGCLLFFGTIKEALASGHSILADLTDISGEKLLKKEEAQTMVEKHILILQEEMCVVVPYKVLYVSEGVEVEENTVIFDEEQGGPAYVIMR